MWWIIAGIAGGIIATLKAKEDIETAKRIIRESEIKLDTYKNLFEKNKQETLHKMERFSNLREKTSIFIKKDLLSVYNKFKKAELKKIEFKDIDIRELDLKEQVFNNETFSINNDDIIMTGASTLTISALPALTGLFSFSSVIPLASFLYGFNMVLKGNSAITQAIDYKLKVNLSCQEIENFLLVFDTLNKRIDELESLIIKTRKITKKILKKIKRIKRRIWIRLFLKSIIKLDFLKLKQLWQKDYYYLKEDLLEKEVRLIFIFRILIIGLKELILVPIFNDKTNEVTKISEVICEKWDKNLSKLGYR